MTSARREDANQKYNTNDIKQFFHFITPIFTIKSIEYAGQPFSDLQEDKVDPTNMHTNTNNINFFILSLRIIMDWLDFNDKR